MSLRSSSLTAAALFVSLVAPPPAMAPAADSKPAVVAGFTLEAIAHVPNARELAATPNGDLLVGTLGRDVDVVPEAEGVAGPAAPFVHLDDDEAAGIALGADAVYVGTTFGVWKIAYHPGDRRARARPDRIATVRDGGPGGHSTTSVAVSGDRVYASVGSSCNACTERDPTRASILRIAAGGTVVPEATHVRNAIALAVDPPTGDLWTGVAGQDELEHGHPYEIFDDVDAHGGLPNYGWPACYEDRRAARAGADCSHVAVAAGAFPAYETPIGAAFYPAGERGRYAFPAAWRGGAFVTLHGSWHRPLVAPLVAFVPVRGRAPAKPVDWNDPTTQWKTFVGGWQTADGARIGRPTGIAVGPLGSLFVADGETGTIYRIRPASATALVRAETERREKFVGTVERRE